MYKFCYNVSKHLSQSLGPAACLKNSRTADYFFFLPFFPFLPFLPFFPPPSSSSPFNAFRRFLPSGVFSNHAWALKKKRKQEKKKKETSLNFRRKGWNEDIKYSITRFLKVSELPDSTYSDSLVDNFCLEQARSLLFRLRVTRVSLMVRSVLENSSRHCLN